MAIKMAVCMICDKDIGVTCPECGSRKPNSDYTQVDVEWSNGSRMVIAVCLNCAHTHAWTTPEAKKKITIAHHDHWTEKGGTFDKEIVIV